MAFYFFHSASKSLQIMLSRHEMRNDVPMERKNDYVISNVLISLCATPKYEQIKNSSYLVINKLYVNLQFVLNYVFFYKIH